MKGIGTTGGLREQRRAQTHQDIIEALMRLLEKDHPAEISMPRVAEESGVSLRTLYRYFPTKAALIDEASKWMNKLASPDTSEYDAIDLHNVADLLTRQWNDFDAHIAGIRAQHTSVAGRELREHRLDKTRAAGHEALDKLGVDASKEDQRRMVDAAIAVGSSSTYLELVDRMDYSSSDAAELAAWVIEAAMAHFARTGTTRPATAVPNSTP